MRSAKSVSSQIFRSLGNPIAFFNTALLGQRVLIVYAFDVPVSTPNNMTFCSASRLNFFSKKILTSSNFTYKTMPMTEFLRDRNEIVSQMIASRPVDRDHSVVIRAGVVEIKDVGVAPPRADGTDKVGSATPIASFADAVGDGPDECLLDRRHDVRPPAARRAGRSTPGGGRLISRLMLTISPIALLVMLQYPTPVLAGPDACTGEGGTTVNCEGDQSAGVTPADIPPNTDYTVLNIRNLKGGTSLGGFTLGSTAVTSEQKLTFNIDTTTDLGPSFAGNISGPISPTFLYNARDGATPVIEFNIASADIGENPAEIFITGEGPAASNKQTEQIGFALDVDVGAPSPFTTLTSRSTIFLQTFGGAGQCCNNVFDAGAAGDITLNATTDVVVDSTDSGDGTAVIFVDSEGGTMFSTATTTRGGRGGDILLTTDSGASFDVTTKSGEPGIRLNSEGGFINLTATPRGGASGSGGNVTIEDANISVTQLGTGAGLTATSVAPASSESVQGLPSGDGGAVDLTGVFDITTHGTIDAPGIVGLSIGGQGGTSGNAGGKGGTVTVDLEPGSSIETGGDISPGLVGQSIGGRGVSQPDVKGLVAFAADGGAGGASSAIDLTNEGQIQTAGNGSFGILAHAVGGGGGAGGDAFGVFFSDAGKGGAGGVGAAVTVTNTGDIKTAGHSAAAIEAQSIGGSGGSGGVAANAFTILPTISIGGGGNLGGTGGNVTVNHSGTIEAGNAALLTDLSDAAASPACTTGCSRGILAQSIGGGGGNAGSSVGWFSLGGKGGGGGTGGEIDVNLGDDGAASITTYLDDSDAVTAHSIGGGGGNGGAAAAGGAFVSAAVGGSGASGGQGGFVGVAMDDTTIQTSGERSHGINAQSIGGGGGNGGFSASFTGGIGVSVATAVGGQGGNGGFADGVAITGSGNSINTSGTDSHGLIAQSIGGGGGNGGTAIAASVELSPPDAGGLALSSAVGGSASSGGTASAVLVDTDSDVTTTGERSKGIIAQSIGGGGGNGGMAIAASGAVSAPGSTSAAVSVGVGGGGGSGGTAANAFTGPDGTDYLNVVVNSSGTVSTAGDAATGILAQGVGGGGGSGGASFAGTLTVGSESNSAGVAVAVGGAGANGGLVNGTTSVTSTGLVTTSGTNADAIVAQSIGGGGGDGGSAIAGGASLSAGDGKSLNVDVAVGGGSGAGGRANDVSVTTRKGTGSDAGSIETTGALSDGIVAQSIGGGGGNGGMAASGSLTFNEGGGSTNAVNVAVGGGASAGGQAGTVDVFHGGPELRATGDGAKGIIAQSIGGGGGSGGMAATGALTGNDGSKELNVAIGGGAGSGGTSGDVTVTSPSRNIVGTTGAFSPEVIAAQQGGNAILAQSIAGGGGSGGLSTSAVVNEAEGKKGNTGDRSLSVDIGGGAGSGGTSGNVFVTTNARTETRGHLSDSIVAQSISGGGGVGGGTINYADSNKSSRELSLSIGGGGGGTGTPGDAHVELTANGAVIASGAGSRGVVVQSIGGSGGAGGSNHFSVKDDDAPGDALNVGIGGNGGSPANAATASFSMVSGASVTTGSGVASAPEAGLHFSGHAVVVQSLGGGGGVGGAGITGKVQTAKSEDSKSFNFGLGGEGAAGGDGGAVQVFNLLNSVPVAIEGTIATSNWNSHGIFAQSMGGGGGDGGTGIDGDVTNNSELGLNIGLGTKGAGGGFGAEVTVLSNAQITVDGDNSKGIFAQSIGGGGGNGGIGVSGDVESGGGDNSKQLTFGLGLSGGGGGAGSSVTVTNGGAITTATNAAAGSSREMDAIFAQSVGGGGGNGGIGIGGSVKSTDSSGGIALTLGIAGSGGAASAGGEVEVDNSGVLAFAGEGSRGIFAQSIGGGGGNGGGGIAGDLSSDADKDESEDKRYHLDVGIGGSGGSAAGGDTVTVNNTATIQINPHSSVVDDTANAVGILAQSVGGGGGNAGIGIEGDMTGTKNTVAGRFGIGGGGGGGGDGQTVTVTNSGSVSVIGDAGRAIHAQSVGGGGGNGAMGVQGTVATGSDDDEDSKNEDGTALTFGLGLSGGNGGDGAAVTVDNSGPITAGSSDSATNRANSDTFGIFAQSVGGGGGTGLVTGGLVFGDVNDDSTARGIDFAVGSTAASGGDGGSVDVTNTQSITTYYDASHALFAQSVGGGGGHAGSLGGIGTGDGELTWGATVAVGGSGSQGDGGEVTVRLSETSSAVATYGDGSHGVFAQSIGGGGGSAANAAGQDGSFEDTGGFTTDNAKIGVTLGGQNGSAGLGRAVTIEGATDDSPALGTIGTQGAHAVGILAQSIGGGGGTGGVGLSGAEGSLISLGASGSSANTQGNAEEVTVTFGGDLTTVGTGAHGILAQSIGGGGGFGGQVRFGDNDLWGTGLDMGSDGTANGSSGGAFVTLSGATITTGSSLDEQSGTDAAGIIAQTVGGGGGIRGQASGALTGASIGSAGGVGSGLGVFVTLSGGSTVTTYGQRSPGIFAQSASGQTGDTGTGAVRVSLSDDSHVNANGRGASGIIAQTVGVDKVRFNNIEIDIDATSSVGGGLGSTADPESENAAIVVLDGNDDNALTNSGTIRAPNTDGQRDVAVRYVGDGRLDVDNNLNIIGSVIIPNGDVTNQEPGLMVPGPTLMADTVTNLGEIEVGEMAALDDPPATPTTVVSGDFFQGETGVLTFDVKAGAADVLGVEGTAALDGAFKVRIVDLADLHLQTMDESSTLLFDANEEMDVAGSLALTSPIAGDFELEQRNGSQRHLSYALDFDHPDVLSATNRSQDTLVTYLDDLFRAGELAGAGETLGLQLLEFYTAEGFSDAADSLSAEPYANTQLSTLYSAQRFADSLMSCSVREGGDRFVREGQCGWFFAGGTWLEQEPNDVNAGFDETVFELSGGGQLEIAPDWHLGAGASYLRKSIDSNPSASADGDQFQLGTMVKHRLGNASLAASLSGGVGWFDTDRVLFNGERASGDQRVWNLSGRIRGAYTFSNEWGFVKPRIDLGVDHIAAKDTQERGDSGSELTVDDSDGTYVSIKPAIEFGGDFVVDDGIVLRPTATVGITHFVNDEGPEVNAGFGFAPDAAGQFTSASKLDQTSLDLSAGLQVFAHERVAVSAEAFGSLSSNVETYGGLLRVEISW